ncbi:MAG: DUF192 domain-containing protein [Elusimicrobiota bacterium]
MIFFACHQPNKNESRDHARFPLKFALYPQTLQVYHTKAISIKRGFEMKKYDFTFLALIGIGLQCFAAPVSPQKLTKTRLYFPSGHKIFVEVADTPSERETGLMFRKSIPRNSGMIFVFPQKTGMEFWMKNTWTSLDIIYIASDKKITRICPRVRASAPNTPDDKVAEVWGVGQYVLELPAGTAARERFKIGQSFRFKVPIPLQ